MLVDLEELGSSTLRVVCPPRRTHLSSWAYLHESRRAELLAEDHQPVPIAVLELRCGEKAYPVCERDRASAARPEAVSSEHDRWRAYEGCPARNPTVAPIPVMGDKANTPCGV